MSSTVCQSFQSCLESRLFEPQEFLLKQAPYEFNFSPSFATHNKPPSLFDCDSQIEFSKLENNIATPISTTTNNVKASTEDTKMGGWSFLQSLTNSSSNTTKCEKVEKEYVHPLAKFSKLSARSLQMCTESLGNETGNDVTEISDEVSLSYIASEKFDSVEHFHKQSVTETFDSAKHFHKQFVAEKRMKRTMPTTFPPPLSSINRSNGVQLKPHREDGRLVLKAERFSSCLPLLQTERSNGRLKIHLLHNCSPNCSTHEAIQEDEQHENPEIEIETETETEIEIEEITANNGDFGGEEEEEIRKEVVFDKFMEGRGKIGIEKVSWASRCKEGRIGGSKRMLNFEPFWVAS